MRGTKTEVRRGVWRLAGRHRLRPPDRRRPAEVPHHLTAPKSRPTRRLAAFLTEVRTGTTIASTDTLNALLDRWLEYVEHDLSPTTVRNYRDKLIRVRRDLGEIKLRTLRLKSSTAPMPHWKQEGISRVVDPPYPPGPIYRAAPSREVGSGGTTRYR